MHTSSTDLPSLHTLFPNRDWPEEPSIPNGTLRGRTVLVTGAGGSLGRGLVRALRQTEVRSVVAVDTGEHRLACLEARVDEAMGNEPPVHCRLADLRQEQDRRRCLDSPCPDLVIHAAAYKRVPFLENRPLAAVENNLLAVADWARACRRAGVERFVFVSTDKAARPTSVMGQTKRAGEEWLRAAASIEAPSVTIVRLCNLFGSKGSVVPLFQRRLQARRPVPVTHPNMKRWMMRPMDGVRSVLASGTLGRGTYVPITCMPVSIPDLARRLIEHERPAANPDDWIEWTGPRPGERLREWRWGPSETPTSSDHPSLWRLERPRPVPTVRGQLEVLSRACTEGKAPKVRTLLESVSEPAKHEPEPTPPSNSRPAVGTPQEPSPSS